MDEPPKAIAPDEGLAPHLTSGVIRPSGLVLLLPRPVPVTPPSRILASPVGILALYHLGALNHA